MTPAEKPAPLLATGIPNLDSILGGGMPSGDLLLLVGPAGSGKTTLALQMAFHTAQAGGRALYVSTYSEPPSRLLRHIQAFSFYAPSAIGKRVFLFDLYPLIQEDLVKVREGLVEVVRRYEADLLIVDGLMTFYELHPVPREVRSFIYELGIALISLGCTTVITSSRASPGDQDPEYTLSDAVIELGI